MVARNEITIGFVGSGKVEKRNAYALLSDFIEASGGNAKFIFPLTRRLWNPALDVVSEFARDKSIPVEAIVDDTTAKVKELKALLAGCRRQHQSAVPAHKMASLLEEARQGVLMVLWDDEDDRALECVRLANEKGVQLLELTRGLDRIELVEGGEEDEPISDEVPEPEDVEEEETISDEGEFEETEDPEEEIPTPEGEDEGSADESEEEFEDAEAGIEAEAEEEFPEDEEEFALPEEDESDVAVLDVEEDTVDVTGMSEFQRRLLAVLENTSAAFVKAIDAIMLDHGVEPDFSPKSAAKAAAPKPAPKAAAPAAKPAARPAAKKVTPPVKKVAKTAPPAKKTSAPPVKRTVPAKKAAPVKAEENGSKSMSKTAAQKIIDGYRPRRGRPPAEVTEARKVLGLA